MKPKLLLLICLLIIAPPILSESPYGYIGDKSSSLNPRNKTPQLSIITVIHNKTSIIAKINFITRVITIEDINGNLLLNDTIDINKRAFLTADSKAEEMPWVSPYVYCIGNPVNLIDPSGCNPIYSTTGAFLGTDDNGLQGEYYIMKASDFGQNMNPEDAKKYAISPAGFSHDVINSIEEHFFSLPDRPDYDGYLTLEEANDWFKNGNGQPLFVDLSKIDLSGIVSLGENYVGQERIFNLLTGASHNINDGLVYGNIKFIRHPNNTVRAYADKYDFDMKSWKNPTNWGRNIETSIGSMFAGKGTPYLIIFHGSAPLKPKYPWVR